MDRLYRMFDNLYTIQDSKVYKLDFSKVNLIETNLDPDDVAYYDSPDEIDLVNTINKQLTDSEN